MPVKNWSINKLNKAFLEKVDEKLNTFPKDIKAMVQSLKKNWNDKQQVYQIKANPWFFNEINS